MLKPLSEAALAISEGLSLPRTLQRIADAARALAQTRYAALGVLADDAQHLKQFITSGIEPQIARRIHHEPSGMGLLGAIFREGVAINIPDMSQDSRSAGFCENHPYMKSFLGVPITYKGRRIGNLYLCDRLDGQPFSAQDEEVVTLLAAHAAIAIENARLADELKNAALRSERDRIGMELHDGVIQSIFAVGMKIEILRNKLNPPEPYQNQFQLVLEDLNHIIEDVRSYIRNLVTARDEALTLRTHIENITTHFRDFSGIPVALDIANDLPTLNDFQRHNLLQILREALANIAHHADASRVCVTVMTIERDVVLKIEDNGKGFDTQIADREQSGHFGLKNMQQRVKRLEGTMQVNSALNSGTTLIVNLPLRLL